jgi:hypothetical protein
LQESYNKERGSVDDSSKGAMLVEVVLSGEGLPVLGTEGIEIFRQQHQETNIHKQAGLYGSVGSSEAY